MKKLVILLLFLCVCGFAEAPQAVAIRNAKIVTVSGPVIAKGTVVVRNGLIEAVGENVTVPADAWVVEGEGLTVYPGLIDSLSTVGMSGAAQIVRRQPPDAAAGAARHTTAHYRHCRCGRCRVAAERARGPEDRPQPPVGWWPPTSCKRTTAASSPCAAPASPPS